MHVFYTTLVHVFYTLYLQPRAHESTVCRKYSDHFGYTFGITIMANLCFSRD